MIIHVFGEVQGPTSTGDLHDEYLKNIFHAVTGNGHIELFKVT